jgi:NAD(P)-dependent dehydrogenase (short-subunit alcohol dehydrogenase family)
VSDLFDLSGRVAIVTGASSGLGARFARVLRAAGADVVLAARRTDRIGNLATELGDEHALAVTVDVRDDASVAALIERAVARFGRLDVMVNNAGIYDPGPAEDEPTSTFRGVLDVNLAAVFSGCREAARVMLPQGSGSIVNVASALGLMGTWRLPNAGYAASKGGVVNLTRDLASQWAGRGLRVNAIAPGWFASEMTAELFEDAERWQRYLARTVPAGRAGREEELDGVLLFLAGDASTYVNGQTIAVDGGWTAV